MPGNRFRPETRAKSRRFLPEIADWNKNKSEPGGWAGQGTWAPAAESRLVVQLPMTQHEALAILRAHAEDIRQKGAQSLYLFGSTVRDEAGPDSDVDIFVDPDYARFTLLDWVDLESFLSEVLGRHVDLTTRNALHPELRTQIERSAMKVL
jgi:uncharacterized protein